MGRAMKRRYVLVWVCVGLTVDACLLGESTGSEKAKPGNKPEASRSGPKLPLAAEQPDWRQQGGSFLFYPAVRFLKGKAFGSAWVASAAGGQALATPQGWPTWVAKLANRPERIYGEMLVSARPGPPPSLRFDYSGDTKALNAFLADGASASDTQWTVILRPSRGMSQMVVDGKHRKVPCAWTFRIGPDWRLKSPPDSRVAAVDVWLGSGIELHRLRVPAKLDVQSGGEIERFVSAHEEKQKRAAKEENAERPLTAPTSPEGTRNSSASGKTGSGGL